MTTITMELNVNGGASADEHIEHLRKWTTIQEPSE